MSNEVYETMKFLAVAGACGYFIGTALGAIVVGIMELIDWIRKKHAQKQAQA